MPLTLILTRHAKSSWDFDDLDDSARPLNTRGRRNAGTIGAWLRTQGHLPDVAFVSNAKRTAETWERLGLSATVQFTQDLYHASATEMLEVLQGADVGTVLVLGHNPGIAEFANRLVRQAPDHPRFVDYPTCATLIAQFDAPTWADVTWHSGTTVDFVVPRELEANG